MNVVMLFHIISYCSKPYDNSVSPVGQTVQGKVNVYFMMTT